MRKETVVFIVVSRKNRKVKESFSYLIAYLLLTAIIIQLKVQKLSPPLQVPKPSTGPDLSFCRPDSSTQGLFFLHPIFHPLLHIKDLWFKSTFRVLHADVLQMMVPRPG